MKKLITALLILLAFATVFGQATNLAPNQIVTSQTLTPTLTWTADASAPATTHYRVTVASASPVTGGTGVYVSPAIAVPTVSRVIPGATLTNNTTYYWIVESSTAGAGGPWVRTSAEATFRTIPAAPSLTTPNDTETDVVINTTFTWGASAGGNFYQLVVDDVPTFLSPEFAPAAGNYTTSPSATGLSHNTTYYWRVRASNDGGVTWGPWAGFYTLTTIAVAAAPTLSTPTDVATGIALNTTFTWNAVVSGNYYELQVDNDAGFGSPEFAPAAGNYTTSAAATGLSNNTTYNWRVRASNDDGYSYGAWSSVFTFTTVPAAPSSSTPFNTATGIALSTTFSWGAVAGGNFYQLQVDDNAGFGSPEFAPAAGNYTTSPAATGLSNNTTYNWRVRASNDGGTTYGDWSSVFTFTTIVASPSLTTPANTATSIALNTTFTWGAVSGANFYELQVDDNIGFGSPEFAPAAGNYTTSPASTGLSNNTVYNWRVRASSDGGATYGDWSSVYTFTTVTAVGAPTLSTPADAASGIALNTTFTWGAVGGANFYQLQVDDNAGFGSPEFAPAAGNYTTSPAATGLSNSTVYNWRVRASNDGGATYGAWSSVFTFTTIPSAPSLTAPANSATGIALNTTFTWGAVATANFYQLQVDNDAGFGSPEFAPASGNYTTSPAATGLNYNTTYNWRVRASNDGGTTYGVWSSVFTFITVPTAPTSSAPTNAANGVALNTTFSWGAVAGGNFYELQVDDNPGFGSPEFAPAAGNYTTSPAATGLSNSTVYNWRVRASNDGGATYGAWSSVFTFTTMSALAAPSLTTPTNTATDIALNTTFSWGAVAGGNFYELQVDNNAGFASPEFAPAAGNYTTSPAATGLSNSTVYNWRVRASDDGGTTYGSWSSTFTFTTIAGSLTAPTLTAPLDIATAASITPQFSWTYGGGGSPTFTVQIATDNAFTSIVRNITPATSPYTLTDILALNNSTIYYWRVVATEGASTATSAVRQFTTITDAKPVLLSPVHLANITGNIIAFQWTMPSTGIKFKLELDNNSDFSSQVTGFPTAFTSLNYFNLPYTVALLPAGNYFWRIKSYTASEDLISISSSWMFTIPGPPSAIAAYPINSQTVYTTSPLVYWYLNNYFYNSAVYYRVRYGITPGNYTLTSPTTTGQYVALPGLTSGQTYYWVIDASTNPAFPVGPTTTTSPEADFNVFYSSITLNALSVYLSYPTAGTTVYSTTPTFYWFIGMQIPGVSYDIQIDNSGSSFPSPEVNTPNITGNEYTSAALIPGATYWWRIKLSSATAWYGPEQFTVHSSATSSASASAVPVPSLRGPIGGTVVSTQSPTLTWATTSTNPLDYQVVWSTSPILNVAAPYSLTNVTAPIGGASGWLVTTSYTMFGLTPGVTYYWQVRARLSTSPATLSNYSSVGQFTVAAGASPVVVLPANPIVGSTINSTAANLSWIVPAKSTSLLKYDLEISKNKNFSNSKIINDLQEPSYQANNLDGNSMYYWRVKSKTLTGISSSYSYSGQFNTGGATSVEGENEIPSTFALEQNYPNPFNPTTVISYSIVKSSFVSLKVFDMLGREVKTLVNQNMTAGKYNLNWNGDDNFGNKVSSGTYIYRITADNFVSSKKMILIK